MFKWTLSFIFLGLLLASDINDDEIIRNLDFYMKLEVVETSDEDFEILQDETIFGNHSNEIDEKSSKGGS